MDWPAYYHRYLDMLHKNRCYLDDGSANQVMGRQEVAEDLVGPVANHSRASKIQISIDSVIGIEIAKIFRCLYLIH